MSGVAPPGGSRTDALLADAARYLDETAPQHGGRNARPLAVPVLVAAHCAPARSWLGAAAAILGTVAGAALWFGLDGLGRSEVSTALVVVALMVSLGCLVAAALLGRRVLRSGSALLTALRRWYAVAPEVPVHGTEVLRQGPGVLRLVLAGLGAIGGIAGIAMAATTATIAAWAGYGIAAASLLGTAVTAALGWWRVHTLLRTAAPQPGHEAFAPAQPGPPATAQHPWVQPAWPQQPPAQHGAPYAQQGVPPVPQPGVPHEQLGPPAQPAPVVVAAAGQAWPPQSPAPMSGPVSVPARAPHAPAVHRRDAPPASTAWAPPPAAVEPDLGDTRFASDTTVSARSRPVAVVLEDGRRLESGIVTLVGRAPRPRPEDPAVSTVAVVDGTVSKTHAAFRVASDSVHVTDRSSTNGTTVVDGAGNRRVLRPWAEEPVEIGSEVILGSYRVRVTGAD